MAGKREKPVIVIMIVIVGVPLLLPRGWLGRRE